MRVAAAIVLLACTARGQFKSTVPLVVAPTTVKDSKGRYVDGLTPQDLILYDNNVPQAIQMDWMTYPIDLVVAVQTSSNSGAVTDKLGFTGNPDLVIHALRMLRKEGEDAHMLDALHRARFMLETAPPRTAANHPHDCGEARSLESSQADRSDGASGAAQCRGLLVDLFATIAATHSKAQDC